MQHTATTIVGNLTKDPELRSTATSGTKVATFRLASTSRRYDEAAGVWTDTDTTFLTVSCWRRLAEHVSLSLRKGDAVIAIGRLVMRSWTDPDGTSQTRYELDARTVGPDLSRAPAVVRRRAVDPQPHAAAPAAGADPLTGEPVDEHPYGSEPGEDPGEGSELLDRSEATVRAA